MSTLLLERPASVLAGADGRREQRLRHLRDVLEQWLPREEARLTAARRARPAEARAARRGGSLDQAALLAAEESEWLLMLRLYERLTTALGADPA